MKKLIIVGCLFLGGCKYFDVGYQYKCNYKTPTKFRIVFDSTIKEYLVMNPSQPDGDCYLWKMYCGQIEYCYKDIAYTGDADSCEEKGLLIDFLNQK